MVAAVKQQQTVQVPAVVSIPQGMTAAWFDQAVARSFEKDLAVRSLGDGRYAMESSRDANRVYLVTADSCGCEGHQRFGRCYHSARAAFEDAFDGPEPSAPVTLPDASNYVVVSYQDGRVGLQWLERRHGITRQVGLDIFPDRETADAAVQRYHRRRQRGPVHAVDCAGCNGWGCDQHGIACQHCHGTGETMQPVPSVAALLAAGRWPGLPSIVEHAA